jgi:adenine-specific DNA-methyltransferase
LTADNPTERLPNREINSKIERISKQVPDIVSDNVKILRGLFPFIFNEDKIDFQKLREFLGEMIDCSTERFSFTWAGKRNSTQIIQMPTRATLIPIAHESIRFESAKNIFIEGDNLEAVKLLYKPYFGKIKMIYIDPPYNTGNDFVYQDNYADPLSTYLKLTKQRSEEGNLLTSNPETSGRFHSSWLSMMYPRLFLLKQLLSDDGLIFISIDDHEFHHLRMIMNELFGEENFLATFVWQRRASSALADKLVSVDHEYVVAYQRGSFLSFLGKNKDYANYSNPDNDPNGDWTSGDLTVGMTKEQRPNQFYDLVDPKTGNVYPANPNRVWGYIPESMKKLLDSGRVIFPEDISNRPMLKRYKKDLKTSVNPVSTWIKSLGEKKTQQGLIELEAGLNAEGTREMQNLFGETVFNYSKPVSLIYSLVKYCTGKDDIILDPFAGSCTTAQAVMELNNKEGGKRRFICIQLQEPLREPKNLKGTALKTIADIGKERIRRIISKIDAEKANSSLIKEKECEKIGFKVFKLAESNFKPWRGVEDKTPEKLVSEMNDHIDSFVKGWTHENVLYEVLIKEGLGLLSSIKIDDKYQKNKIWRVTDSEYGRSLLICLDDKIDSSIFEDLEFLNDELFICRDIALDDTTAANLALQCRLKTI